MKKKNELSNVVFYFIVVTALFACTVFGYLISATPGKRAKENYHNAVSEAYDRIYEKGRAAAEEQWHVSNVIDIRVGEIKETANLQVFKVYDSEFIMHDKAEDGVFSCLEVTGSGDYTIDLLASEFVVDNNRKYVLVRIPKPVLKNIMIKESKILTFKDGIFDGSMKQGVNLAERDLKEAANRIESSLVANVSYSEKAMETAKVAVENLVKEFNTDVEGLTVEVVFFE